ncbi:hypothetical protein FGO68_gene3055 [Halteria grandinella]|uniref:Uncharacterized protein n=1 Tax=Halteria grandinella TaxID=5974 RepID=A0A8J8T0R0_HALGN|nr:hypothetical protein FGO68_gene3055 [Halteria grandinella]
MNVLIIQVRINLYRLKRYSDLLIFITFRAHTISWLASSCMPRSCPTPPSSAPQTISSAPSSVSSPYTPHTSL